MGTTTGGNSQPLRPKWREGSGGPAIARALRPKAGQSRVFEVAASGSPVAFGRLPVTLGGCAIAFGCLAVLLGVVAISPGGGAVLHRGLTISRRSLPVAMGTQPVARRVCSILLVRLGVAHAVAYSGLQVAFICCSISVRSTLIAILVTSHDTTRLPEKRAHGNIRTRHAEGLRPRHVCR